MIWVYLHRKPAYDILHIYKPGSSTHAEDFSAQQPIFFKDVARSVWVLELSTTILGPLACRYFWWVGVYIGIYIYRIQICLCSFKIWWNRGGAPKCKQKTSSNPSLLVTTSRTAQIWQPPGEKCFHMFGMGSPQCLKKQWIIELQLNKNVNWRCMRVRISLSSPWTHGWPPHSFWQLHSIDLQSHPECHLLLAHEVAWSIGNNIFLTAA